MLSTKRHTEVEREKEEVKDRKRLRKKREEKTLQIELPLSSLVDLSGLSPRENC